ncbi:MAG: hypothetical protein IPN90_00400 [Elusimicrobia bacterium]|nr:hypothetical protein [Elusimicrobiota bacterium]
MKHYRDVRKRGIDLMMRIVDCLPEGLILQAAEDLRLLSKDRRSLSSDGEENMDFIFDRAIPTSPGRRNDGLRRCVTGETGDFSRGGEKYLTSHRAPVFSFTRLWARGWLPRAITGSAEKR